MTILPPKHISGVDWTLRSVGESERALLDRMLQFYFYDFSENDPDDVNQSGLFECGNYERYGREPGFDAWLLRVNEKPAGFALVDVNSTIPGNHDRHYIHEFHVLRAYRRRGYGLAMAHDIFDHYPGRSR